MDDQQLRRLSRAELLKMLLQITEDNERLTQENESLQKQIADRSIALQQTGSIAEAALKVNGVFVQAQKAADQYQENVKRISDQTLQETKKHCQQMIEEAQAKCQALKQQSAEAEEAQWQRTRQRLDQYIKTHANWQAELHEKIKDDSSKQ